MAKGRRYQLNVLICYADKAEAACTEALFRHYPYVNRFYVGDDDYAYWRHIRNYWGDRNNDLLLIEHDIEITAETVPSLRDCPEPWCVYTYAGSLQALYPTPETLQTKLIFRYLKEFRQSLGCTKFSAELMHAVPLDMADNVHYGRIDTTIGHALMTRGYRPHIHGSVKHYHRYVIFYVKPELNNGIDFIAGDLDNPYMKVGMWPDFLFQANILFCETELGGGIAIPGRSLRTYFGYWTIH